ncbi:MAG: nickel-dependent lactate racemase [Candidatus Eisenbacteria bacterium]|nr:nickel-dependent lactate racemase [Candidatus Eisenbacteria bacterium]
MEARVAYGSGFVPMKIPAGIAADILDAEEPFPLADPAQAIAAALASPIDSPPLADLAQERSSAVVLVPDATRPLPLSVVLPPILDALETALARERITILFATGMHRPVSEGEAAHLLGSELAGSIRWISHDCERTRTIGRAPRGTPIALSETLLEADLRLAVGLVEPHLLAGFSGGRKLVAPGVIGLEAMSVLHGPEIVGHRKARAGILDGNPFHEEALAIARAARLDFAVNLAIGKGRRISGVWAGEIDRSHRAASSAVEKSARVATDGERDLVITSGGGAPLDATFYQSVKGIVGAEALARERGAVLLCASCGEGWGSEPFVSLLEEARDLPSFLEWAARPGSFRKDQWMVQHLREAMEKVEVYLFSERLDAKRARAFGLKPVRSPEEGIEAALAGIADPSVAVIPRGPYTWAVA